MANEFKIGATLIGMVFLYNLNGAPPAPDSIFQKYSADVSLGSGSVLGLGKHSSEWHWSALTADQRDALRAYCAGSSAAVFIRTRDDDNNYDDYSAVMVWPQNEKIDAAGYVLDFSLGFVQMVEA
jgi:hypothetical protein